MQCSFGVVDNSQSDSELMASDALRCADSNTIRRTLKLTPNILLHGQECSEYTSNDSPASFASNLCRLALANWLIGLSII